MCGSQGDYDLQCRGADALTEVRAR
jgi:hypothetical protein